MEYESFHEEIQDKISKTSYENILEESKEESENILLEESEDTVY